MVKDQRFSRVRQLTTIAQRTGPLCNHPRLYQKATSRVPGRVALGDCSPRASHRRIAPAARLGRVPVVAHWVMSWLSASHNSYIRSFVSHPQLFRPWIPNSMPCQHFRPRSDCFWLLELGVFQTFLDNLRPICSGHGYPTQCAASTSCPRADRFWLLELRVSRTFLYMSRPKDGAGQVSTGGGGSPPSGPTPLVGFPPPGLRGRPCPAFLCGAIPLHLDEIRLPWQDSRQPFRSPILLPRADQART